MELVDFYVLKDGLPIFSKEENRRSETSCQGDRDQLTMISGFLCAVSSFAANLGRFGSMRELSMSENIKLSFHKEVLRNTELLFVLITKDSDAQEVNRRLLLKLAGTFAFKFRKELMEPWNGDVERFSCFYDEMMRDYESFMHDMRIREHILYLKQREILSKQLNRYGSSRLGNSNGVYFQEKESEHRHQFESQISRIVPVAKIEDTATVESLSISRFAVDVFEKINGNKTLHQIAQEMGVSVQDVFNVCKSLVKSGFIVFTQ